jgi:small subunit ribosomal protein S2
VGIVDSNSDPDAIDYPIPMNDDASKALEYVLDLFKEAVKGAKKNVKKD